MKFKNLLKISFFTILLFLVSNAFAQETVVTGKVIDSKDNTTMPGVTVMAKGTSIATNTDGNGIFKLSVPGGTTTLVFSFVGYEKKEVALTGAPLNVSLTASNTSLNEVLVVGYGTVRKKDATGAVVKLSSADFVKGVTTNPLQQLQGQAAGVVITTNSGDPTGNFTVRIRGTASLAGGNDPLYVIDGVAGGNPASLSPSDIESFTILKDASSAAIYGSRASGGVILITTKSGKAGKAEITYNSYVATETAEHLIKFMDASQYLAAFQSFYGHAMPTGTTTTSNQGANTNWFKELLQTGVTQQHNLAISGGTDKSHYRGSVTYTDQQGIALTSGQKSLKALFNYDQKALDDKLTITMNFDGVHSNSSYVDSSAFLDAASVPSVISLRDPNGSGNYQYINNTNETNPVPHLVDVTNVGQTNRFNGNLQLDYLLAKGWHFTPFLRGLIGSSSNNLYLPPSNLLSSVIDRQGFTLNQTTIPGELSTDGDVDKTSSTESIMTYGFTTAYSTTFGKSRLNLTAGYEGNNYNFTGLRVAAHNFNDIDLPNENISAANQVANGVDINSYDNGYKLDSWFGRAEYNLKDKYYLYGSLRYDYSNKLGINHQSQVFPSISGAWTISSEDFMKDVSWISSLKLRGGWGQVGDQDAISAYASQSLFGSTGTPYYSRASGSFLTSNFAIQNPNPDLRWETKSTSDVAVDFSLFAGRLTGSADYYSAVTNYLLYNYAVPTGGKFFVGNILANIGSMTNKGFDFSLNGLVMKSGNFSWRAGVNVSFNRNKITNLSGSLDGTDFKVVQANIGTTSGLGISGAISQIGYLKVGYPIGTLLLPVYAGQSSTGRQTFYYTNSKGARDTTSNVSLLNYADNGTGDRKFYTTDPKFTYGISNNFTYKKFDLGIYLRGQYGSHGFNETYMDYSSLTKLGTYGIIADASKYGITSSSEPSSFWLESTAFLKVQNATLGYNFELNNNKYISNLHVFIAGNNLYTFTSYKGLDPELVTTGGETGIDVRTLYPRARELSAGLSITLK